MLFCNILTLDRAINQEIHLCKSAEEQRKQVGIKQKYNQDTDGLSQFELESVGDKMPNWEPAADRGLWALNDPLLRNPAKMKKKCCYGQKNLGQFVAVCLRLQLTSHTQETSTLSRIKRERYVFTKKCVHSFIEVCILCLIMFLLVYVYVYGYTTILLWITSVFILNIK